MLYGKAIKGEAYRQHKGHRESRVNSEYLKGGAPDPHKKDLDCGRRCKEMRDK